jgi:hypothetical protein
MDEPATPADRSTGSNSCSAFSGGITMKLIRHTSALIAGVLVAAATLLALGPAAFAQPAPPPAGGDAAPVPTGASLPVPADRVIVSHHGSPLWAFVVVAITAIALTLVAQVLLAKTRPVLRRRLARA